MCSYLQYKVRNIGACTTNITYGSPEPGWGGVLNTKGQLLQSCQYLTAGSLAPRVATLFPTAT